MVYMFLNWMLNKTKVEFNAEVPESNDDNLGFDSAIRMEIIGLLNEQYLNKSGLEAGDDCDEIILGLGEHGLAADEFL
jgi:hypothetical protein